MLCDYDITCTFIKCETFTSDKYSFKEQKIKNYLFNRESGMWRMVVNSLEIAVGLVLDLLAY